MTGGAKPRDVGRPWPDGRDKPRQRRAPHISRGSVRVPLIGLVTMAVVAAGVVTPAAAVTPMGPPLAATSVIQPPTQTPPPAIAVAAEFKYFSAAFLSPTKVIDTEIEGVTNAANIQRLIQVSVRRPQPDQVGANNTVTYTQLHLRTSADPNSNKVVFADPDNVVAPSASVVARLRGAQVKTGKQTKVNADDRSYTLIKALDRVCKEGTRSGSEDNQGNYFYVSCRLDPSKWQVQGKNVQAEKSSASSPKPKETLIASATATQDEVISFPLAIGGTSNDSNPDASGAERAKNLNDWLTALAGNQLQPDSTGAKLTVPAIAQLSRVTQAEGGQAPSVAPGQDGSADLTWDQCFLPQSAGITMRASCTPDSNYRMSFGKVDEGTGGEVWSVPSGTSDNAAFGGAGPRNRMDW